MARHDRRDVVAVDSGARARIRNGYDRCRVGALGLRVADWDHGDEIRVGLIDIGRGRPRRHGGRPVAVRIRYDSLHRADYVGDDDVHVRNVWLADLLRAVPVGVHEEVAAHGRRVEVAVDSRSCAHVGHGHN